MTTSDSHHEPVSLRTEFELSWRGFARKEVRGYLATVESEMHALTAELEEAAAHAESAARRIAELTAENTELRTKIDSISRVPIEPDALQERSRRMIEITREEAVEITAGAEEAAARLQAEAKAKDEAAERRRERADADFDHAMAVRRAEAMAVLAGRDADSRSRADQLILEASERGEQLVAEARRRADEADRLRLELTAQLQSCQEVLAEALPLLDPVPGEGGLGLPTQRTVRLSVQDTVPIKPLSSHR
jgi:cell division septum initiation protein DivIVA